MSRSKIILLLFALVLSFQALGSCYDDLRVIMDVYGVDKTSKKVELPYHLRKDKFLRDRYEEFRSKKINQQGIFKRAEYVLKNITDSPQIKAEVEALIKWIEDNPKYFKHGKLLPEGFVELFHVFKSSGKRLSHKDFVTYRILIEWFIMGFSHKHGEKGLLEMLWTNSQLQRELNNPGSSKLIKNVILSDLHGGSRRAIPMVAHALGLPKDNQIATVKELKRELKAYGITPDPRKIRFLHLSDIYDRGVNPGETHRLVEYLVSEVGVGRNITGNHDLWHLLGILGVHKLKKFKKLFNNTGGMHIKELEKHHVAWWARDIVIHKGWGDKEIDELNLERLNELVKELNREHALNIKPFRGEEIYTAEYSDASRVETFNKIVDSLGERAGSKVDFHVVTRENMLTDKEIKRRALWDAKNFSLYYIDQYGNFHLHSALPFAKKLIDGKEISYLDVKYKNAIGIEALDLMQNEVRSFFGKHDTIPNSEAFREKMWKEIGPIFETVNSWYSDVTATSKMDAVKEFIGSGGHTQTVGHGMDDSLTHRDIRPGAGMIIGHNEIKKHKKDNVSWFTSDGDEDLPSYMISADGSMSDAYEGKGRMIIQGPHEGRVYGILSLGYKDQEATHLIDETFKHMYGDADNSTNKNLLEKIHGGTWWMENKIEINNRIIARRLNRLIIEAKEEQDLKAVKYYQELLNICEKS